MANYTTKLTCNTSQHDNALKRSANEVYKYNKSIDSAKNILTKFGKKVPQIAAVLGVSTGAMATFKKLVEQTQSATDTWGRATNVVNGAIDTLTNRLSGVGFGSFIDGLKESAKAAREVYNELDQLGTMTIFNDKATADFNYQKAQYERIIKDKNSSQKQVKEAQAGLKKLMENYVKSQNALAAQAINTYKAQVRQWFANANINVTDGFIEKYFGSLSGYESAQREYSNLYKKIYGVGGKGGQARWEDYYDINGNKAGGYWNMQNVNQDDLKRMKALEVVTQISDEKLKEANANYINARNIQTKLIQEETQQMLMNNKVNTRIEKTNTPKEDKPEDPKTALEELQEELKKLNRDKEMLVAKDGSILDKKLWDEIEGKIENITEEISRIQYLLNPIVDIKLPAGEYSTYEDYEESIKVMEAAQTQASEIIKSSNETIYNSIKDISGAMDSLIGVFEQWKNISKGDADFADYFKAITSSIFTTIDAITSVIQAINVISTTATAVKTAQALIDASVTKANLAEMASKVVAFYAELGPLGLAPASTTIAAYSAMAKIGAFAGGGIVEGSSYIGDNNLARVNAGEMILNGTQQSRLFHMLNGIGVPDNRLSGDVRFEISGDRLYGVLQNHNNKINRVL